MARVHFRAPPISRLGCRDDSVWRVPKLTSSCTVRFILPPPPGAMIALNLVIGDGGGAVPIMEQQSG